MARTLRSSTITGVLVAATFCSLPAVGFAIPIVAQYTFNNTLASSVAGAPALVAIDPLGQNAFATDTVAGQTRSIYEVRGNASPLNQQGGLTLNTTGLVSPTDYSVELVASLSDRNSAYRRLLDVQNRQSDDGFYVDPSNHLDVYPASTNSGVAFTSNAYHDIILSDNNGVVTGYLDGVSQFTTTTNLMDLNLDPTNNPNQLLGLFADNVQGGGQGEYSNANIALLNLYSGAIDPTTAATIGATPVFTAPPTAPAVPYSTGANNPCVPGTLQSYVNLSQAGCTVGPATFYNFSASGTYSAATPANVTVFNGITVAPNADGSPGLSFTSSSLFNVASGTAQYKIDYDIDPPIDLLGFSLRDAPFVNSSVNADICIGNTFAINCPPGAASGDEFSVTIDDGHANGSAVFPQGTSFNEVHETITLDATKHPASIEGFGQGSLVAGAVPEPGLVALLGMGGLAGAASTLRRRRRIQPVRA